MITIKYDATTCADVGSHGKRFLDEGTTLRTCLTGILWWNGYHRDVMQSTIVVEPIGECCPSCIVDRFSQFAVADHVPDLKVFKGNQVVRRDIRVCRLPGKIFTLPLN